jgi:hypothetical protein
VPKLCGQIAGILIVAAGGKHIFHRYLTAQEDYGYKNNSAVSLTECNIGKIKKLPIFS